MTLLGVNTFGSSGATGKGMIMNAGVLNINNAKALGVGTFTINGGTIDNTTAAPIVIATNGYNNAQTWNSDFVFTGTQNLDFNTGAISLGTSAGTSRKITVTNSGHILTEGGIISDGSNGTTALVKDGNGTLALTGANTFSGGMTLNAGVLDIASAQPKALGSGTFTINGGTIDHSAGVATVLSNSNQVWNGDFDFRARAPPT